MDNNYCIYKYTNQLNGKVYIGQTKFKLSRRARENGKAYKRCISFYRAIEKYGWDNFVPSILESNLTIDEANNKEMYWISFYRSTNPKYGYNIREGGYNAPIAEETRQKISRTNSDGRRKGCNSPCWGTHLSEETKHKISNSKIGKHLSQEQKDTISRANKGHKPYEMTDETRKKISQSKKGVPLSDIAREHIIKAIKSRPNPFLGKHHTEETKNLIRSKLIGKMAKGKHPNAKAIIIIDTFTNEEIYCASRVEVRDKIGLCSKILVSRYIKPDKLYKNRYKFKEVK